MNCVGVIPARFLSQRLPRKVLLTIADKPMIYWVYRRACQAGLDDVYIATDHPEIMRAVAEFDGKAMFTRSEHQSGTARVAEVAGQVDAQFFVNIQGDEPMISPDVIRAVADLIASGKAPVASAMVAMTDPEGYRNPAVVKVVCDGSGKALYFSRSPIPFHRDSGAGRYYKHLGIYGYSREFLLGLPSLPSSRLEDAEKLEQLRFLENGFSIQMVEVQHDSVGVDTAEDLERVREMFQAADVQ
jgi:3-deoxy-manno-octulosonate cytidylyltransferase (CMP-KDO synthetase)